jgi:hypothetical protein
MGCEATSGRSSRKTGMLYGRGGQGGEKGGEGTKGVYDDAVILTQLEPNLGTPLTSEPFTNTPKYYLTNYRIIPLPHRNCECCALRDGQDRLRVYLRRAAIRLGYRTPIITEMTASGDSPPQPTRGHISIHPKSSTVSLTYDRIPHKIKINS